MKTCDVGRETGSAVSDDYTAETSRFNGTINWIRLDQGAVDHDHLISPEERLTVAIGAAVAAYDLTGCAKPRFVGDLSGLT